MDVGEKLLELVDKARRYAANKCHSFVSCAECDHYGEHDGNCRNTYIAESLIADGVTVQDCCHKAESVISKTCLMCTACHSDIDHDAVFCKYCGAKVMPQPPKGE